MMRAAILAMAAALAAPAVLAQQIPLLDNGGTVAQPRFEVEGEAEPQGEVAEQPRFVRAPGEAGFEVTPLAPPGGAGETAVDIPLGAPEVFPQGAGDGLPERDAGIEVLNGQEAGVEVLHDQPGYDDPADSRRFKTVPNDEDGTALIRPDGEAVPIDPPSTEMRAGVRLRELDKMTGQTETFEIAVGETRQVDRLKIRLEACRSPGTNDTHGTIAFLKVWDIREPEDEAFSGWMFAESPSLSALDHPRYDLWVISCTTSDVAVSSPSE